MNPVLPYIVAGLLLGAFAGGWAGRGWYEDSQAKAALDAEIARRVEVEGERDAERAKNTELRGKLARSRVARPVVCDQSPSRLRDINAALAGAVPKASAVAGADAR